MTVERLVPVGAFADFGLMAGDAVAQGTSSHHKSVFDRLGGKPAVRAVVDQFVANCAADVRINTFFAAAAADHQRLNALKGVLDDQKCHVSLVTGGGHA